MDETMREPPDVRLGTLDDIARIGAIDRTEDIALEYHCRLTGEGHSIEMAEEYHDPPKRRPPWSAEGVRRRVASWTRRADDGGVVLVCEAGERLVGIAILGPEQPGKCAEIVALFVSSGFRKRGLGSRLIQSLEQEARRRGLEALYVGSNESENSVGFYQRMGFRIVCLLDSAIVWIPGLETEITLAKRIGPE